MLPSHLKRLCITSATLIAASPLATVASQPTPLLSALQQAVPSCAQSCLQASLAEKFPVACTGQEDIQCLCSRYSNGGESLGEVALGCVYSSCSMVDRGAATAYNVCLGQKDAVVPTKTALTVVASSMPRTTSTSFSSRSAATPSITTTMQTQVTPTQSVFVDSILSTPGATATPSSTSTAVLVAIDDTPRMTPAQIAGLSVAAVAAFVIAVGLMALSVCLRRRKERKNGYDADEKGLGQGSKKRSTRFSHYVKVDSIPEAPKQFPMAPPAPARKGGRYPGLSLKTQEHPTNLYPSRPVQRNRVGTYNNSSDSSLSLSQIGLAISAELDGKSAAAKSNIQASSPPQQVKVSQGQLNVPFRPVSTMTQDTVFEEDEVTVRRRSSALLPTPPFPIPPIRSLQPSRLAGTSHSVIQFPFPPSKSGRHSELFLDIPIRHERPQPKRIIAAEMPSTGSPKQLLPSQANRLAPPNRIASSSSPQKTPASSQEPSNAGDIDEYYFSSHNESPPKASPARFARRKSSPALGQIRSKTSQSTVSRTSSRSSTNIRDSISSQTSFETVDPSDPTPEDEDDDKQLSDENQLSPVAESPISNLRYPKIPRASNQLVPRSPKPLQSPHSLKSSRNRPSAKRNLPSPRPTPSPSVLLQNRRKDLAPLLLETRVPLKLNAPKDMAILRDPFTSPPRQPRTRAHVRSNSTESWATTPRSKVDRKSRTQSGMWPSSPAMYDEPVVVKPLNVKRKNEEPLSVRRRRDEMKEINVGRDAEIDGGGLKSPVWVPRLTPTRKGEDLFISVGWGERRR